MRKLIKATDLKKIKGQENIATSLDILAFDWFIFKSKFWKLTNENADCSQYSNNIASNPRQECKNYSCICFSLFSDYFNVQEWYLQWNNSL